MEHIIVNDDVRLETVKLSMAEVIFTTIDGNRGTLKKWLPFVDMTRQINDTEIFLQSVINQPSKKRDEIYSIWFREEFAGLIGFKETDWVNRKTEIGYWLSPKMEGKGIATSCAKKLTRFAFKKLKLNRVQVKVAVGNVKSSAIPKRLGFQLEGIERAGELNQNKFFDLEIYSLLKSDLL